MSRPGLPASVRAVPGLVGGALDGMVVWFATAYLAVTTVSGSSRAIALGPAGDAVITAILVGAALGIASGILIAACRAAGLIQRGVRHLADHGRAARSIGAVVAVPFRLVAALPATVALMAALLLVIFVLAPAGPGGLLAPDAALGPYVWFGAAVGAGVGMARTGWRRIPVTARRTRMGVTGSGLAVAVAIGLIGTALLLDPGSDAHLVRPTPTLDGTVLSATLEDPGAPGPRVVTTFTYGSGADRRPEYGVEARLRTPTVDASRAMSAIGGGADEARRWYWGFGLEALPLNGRVWMPSGDGPFPLVLIVHGNHAMGAQSDAGYGYLAEHLASRGFIAVSIDENFLNGSWAGDYHGGEQVVRAWLLLLHLDQWRAWNADTAGPLAGRVDMDRVAVIGHSRGGEAASVAAELASLDGAFNPMLRPWPTGLTIRAVVSISPSDGQYGPDVRLDGVDLLELAGGHDADAMGWSGIRQYNRATPGTGGFKAALYAYRANHGQFNTVWGRGDQGPWSGGLLNLRPVETAAEQEDVARTAISAFLEASLHDAAGYRAFFRRPMVGREWLPDDVYLVRSDDGSDKPLVDVAGTGGAAPGFASVTVGLASAGVSQLPLRALQDTQGGEAATLEWEAGPGTATWGVSGLAKAGGPRPASASELHLALANATTTPGGEAAPALDPLVVVTSTDGVTVALPLSTWGALPPPLVARLVKSDLLATLARISGLDLTLRSPAEVVLQSYRIPLSAFSAADPAFVPSHLDSVALQMPKGEAGRLAVAEFGIADGR